MPFILIIVILLVVLLLNIIMLFKRKLQQNTNNTTNDHDLESGFFIKNEDYENLQEEIKSYDEREKQQATHFAKLREDLAGFEATNNLHKENNRKLEQENIKLKEQYQNLLVKNSQNEQKLETLSSIKESLAKDFKEISQEAIEVNGKKLKEQQKEDLKVVLSPFKDEIKDFKENLNTIQKENRESKGSLDRHIENLSKLNMKVSQEANNLVDALKGNNKTQGLWGEVILTKTLEMAGLVEGRDFKTQEKVAGSIPDVIVKLPEDRDIIVDSKVSLNAYTRFINAENEEQETQALKDHMKSLESHIKDLSSKEYHKLQGTNSLDYVVMFMPIESAYITAIGQDPDILKKAYNKNIVLATPSTLLMILRTIKNLWNIEKQNKNAEKLWSTADKLYDKLVGFATSMEKVNKDLSTLQKSQETAYKQLSHGNGNAIKLARALQDLGAKSTKSFSDNLIEESENTLHIDSEKKDEENEI